MIEVCFYINQQLIECQQTPEPITYTNRADSYYSIVIDNVRYFLTESQPVVATYDTTQKRLIVKLSPDIIFKDNFN